MACGHPLASAVDCSTEADDSSTEADDSATDQVNDSSATKCTHPTVLILGKAGTAKIDIAQHIFRKSKFGPLVQDTGLNAATRAPSLDVHHNIHLFDDKPVMVIALDTNPNFSSQVLFQKVAEISTKISVIFLVMTHGRVTMEDYKPLNDIIKEFSRKLTPEILNCCYLVVNGCEGHTEASREEIIATYKKDPLTRDICRSVVKIIPVGFPDLTLINPELHEHYQTTIKEDEDSLHHIVKELLSCGKNYSLENKSRCTIS